MDRQRDEKPELTVYYDGACPLCTAEITHYETREGANRIAFEDVALESTDTGPDLTKDAARSRFHVRRADGTILSGARAFVAIWETLPGWKPLARLAKLPGIIPVLEAAYRIFLPLRPTLSRIARLFGARPRSGT